MGKSLRAGIQIDGEALRREFRVRNVWLKDASANLGYDPSYLSKASKVGRISKSAMLLIQAMYNINPDIYVVKEEPKSEEVKAEVVEVVQHSGLTDDDLQKLYKVIYTAVYEATKRALSE